MMADTAELGPILNTYAPDFALQDHERHVRNLKSIIGQRGVLLGFIADIWKPASIRRILYMQKHFHKFAAEGYNVALLIADQQHTLYSFYMSSPMTVSVPLLADPDYAAHRQYNMRHSGLVLVDSAGLIRAKWMMPEERVWPKVRDLLNEVGIAS